MKRPNQSQKEVTKTMTKLTLDFSDCKTVEEVNKKWLEYAKDIEPYKALLKKLTREHNQTR